MKKTNLLIGIGIGFGLALLLTAAYSRKKKLERKLAHVAEEGYETAADILYPGLPFRRKKFNA